MKILWKFLELFKTSENCLRLWSIQGLQELSGSFENSLRIFMKMLHENTGEKKKEGVEETSGPSG